MDTAAMDDLDWLAGHVFRQAIRHEYTWSFEFDGSVTVVAECLWRLTEDGRIRVTSADEGQKFGRPTPVDAALDVNQRLAGTTCHSVVLHAGTLDLEIHFNTGHILQVIPDSSGYEAWQVYEPTRQFIAVGGGDLTIFGPVA